MIFFKIVQLWIYERRFQQGFPDYAVPYKNDCLKIIEISSQKLFKPYTRSIPKIKLGSLFQNINGVRKLSWKIDYILKIVLK